jgi:hypothetical protein
VWLEQVLGLKQRADSRSVFRAPVACEHPCGMLHLHTDCVSRMSACCVYLAFSPCFWRCSHRIRVCVRGLNFKTK